MRGGTFSGPLKIITLIKYSRGPVASPRKPRASRSSLSRMGKLRTRENRLDFRHSICALSESTLEKMGLFNAHTHTKRTEEEKVCVCAPQKGGQEHTCPHPPQQHWLTSPLTPWVRHTHIIAQGQPVSCEDRAQFFHVLGSQVQQAHTQ